MNQLCKVCGEPAAGFHFGAFTCEGCKSFFGRTYNNISAIAGCKNNGDCVINKKNRTACKACRLRKCLLVGMSKSGSRYGRRSNWFKIHCLLQEQQTHQMPGSGGSSGNHSNSNFEQLARLHQMQARQTYQDKTNPCIKTASMSPTTTQTTATTASTLHAGTQSTPHSQRSTSTPTNLPPNSLFAAAKFLNGVDSGANHQHHHQSHQHHSHHQFNFKSESTSRLSDTPSDSGASSAGDAGDDAYTTRSSVSEQRTHTNERNCNSAHAQSSAGGSAGVCYRDNGEERERRRRQLLQIFRSHSEPLKSPFTPFAAITNLPPPTTILNAGSDSSIPTHATQQGRLPAALLKQEIHKCVNEVAVAAAAAAVATSDDISAQDEPIDLSLKSLSRYDNSHTPRSGRGGDDGDAESCGGDDRSSGGASPASAAALNDIALSVIQKKPAPLDLTLVRSQQTLTG